jgi:hypothetical protein
VSSSSAGVLVQVPSPLSCSEPLPEVMARFTAVRVSPSTSVALAKSSAWVISRGPLSSAIAASVTGVVTGASLTGVTMIVVVLVTDVWSLAGPVDRTALSLTVAVTVRLKLPCQFSGRHCSAP